MTEYAADISVRQARAQYFAANGLGEGGYQERWVKLRVGPFAIYMPNTAARVRAVRFHDIHHVLTGYHTTWLGEAEIAAWEISSGCAKHYAAWYLNLMAMAIGLGIDRAAVVEAFYRGCHSDNLYRATVDEGLLDSRVGMLRKVLRLDQTVPPASISDRRRLIVWLLASWSTLAGSLLVILAPIGLAWLLLS